MGPGPRQIARGSRRGIAAVKGLGMAAPVREIVEFWASPSAWTGMLLRRVARDEKAYAAAVAQRLRPFAPRRGYTPSRPESQLRRLGQGWRHPFFNRVQSF